LEPRFLGTYAGNAESRGALTLIEDNSSYH